MKLWILLGLLVGAHAINLKTEPCVALINNEPVETRCLLENAHPEDTPDCRMWSSLAVALVGLIVTLATLVFVSRCNCDPSTSCCYYVDPIAADITADVALD